MEIKYIYNELEVVEMADKTKVGLYLSDAMLERIDGYCEVEGMTRNAYIQMALKIYLDQQRAMDMSDLAVRYANVEQNL